MSSAREVVYDILTGDPVLQGLGFDSVLTGYAADSPAARLERWIMLRWGVAEAPVGRDTTTRAVVLSVWPYNRQMDYDPIQKALWRCQELILPIANVPIPGGGFVVAADYSFSSEDLYDEVYRAIMRGDTYRVVTTRI